MFRRMLLFIVFTAIVATNAFAAAVVTSVSPTALPVDGGTRVTIKGTGFSPCIICSPPFGPWVLFGATPARDVLLVDSTTIIAVAPPLLPGTYDVFVDQYDGRVRAPQSVTYSGDYTKVFETILLPIYSQPVHGAFGSEFHTIVRGANSSGGRDVFLYGRDSSCYLFTPVLGPEVPMVFTRNREDVEFLTNCSEWPTRMFYVPKDEASSLALNLRVADVSRTGESHGTEIPVVRSADIKSERIVLLGAPVDPRYRNTLRIYSSWKGPIPVTVTINGRTETVVLQAGADMFEPSYAIYTNFPTRAEVPAALNTITVTIDPPPTPPIGIPVGTAPIWAFITVTNNDTQQITTITPN